jgi:uncharacterized protein with NAD-binding domain and iron-sulfur cluster
MSAEKTKVAILGGGPGGVAAAFWLSSSQELRDRFEVTLYTQGWRLGGKCASARNYSAGERIEEHGLHMFMGFYRTAFATMRAVYPLTRRPDDRFRSWTDAFTPQRLVSLGFAVPDGKGGTTWSPWTIEFPELPGNPGDLDDTGLDYLARAPKCLIAALRSSVWPLLHDLLGRRVAGSVIKIDFFSMLHVDGALAETTVLFEERFAGVSTEIAGFFRKLYAECSLETAWLLGERLPADHSVASDLLRELRRLQECFNTFLVATLRSCEEWGFHLYVMISLGFAGLIGYLDDVLPKGDAGFDALNALDFRAWLKSHGAPDDALGPGPVQAIYDLAFAYEAGEAGKPGAAKMAAGAALRLVMRMCFGYRNAPLWRMQAGAGDVIFTPLYRYLAGRHVAINFFHRVRDLGVKDGLVETIEIDRQLDVKNGRYLPLQEGDDRWPAEPLWDQIVDGDVLGTKGLALESPWCTFKVGEQTLRRGQDFDVVVLAMPPLALKPISAQLAASVPWRNMLDNMTAVPTQSVQLWMKPDLSGLGWKNGQSVLTAYAQDLSSWADMSQVREGGAGDPGSCQYLCGVYHCAAPLPVGENPTFIDAQTKSVVQRTEAWLDENAGVLWPGVCPNGKALDRSVVTDRYYRVNIGYSDQYVQTFPGSVQYRLDPGKSGFANVFLAGDWTLSSINGGSVESAFESGQRAAEAITQKPSPAQPD